MSDKGTTWTFLLAMASLDYNTNVFYLFHYTKIIKITRSSINVNQLEIVLKDIVKLSFWYTVSGIAD